MYNREYKMKFIETLDVKEISEERYVYLFEKTAEVEFKINKDLFDMNFEELEITFYAAKRSKHRSLISYITTIKNYITWAKDNGYGVSPVHPIVESINTSFVDKYLYKEGLTYYTREALLMNIEKLINVRDKAIVLAVFEGIRGKALSELTNLRYEDLSEKEGKYYASLLSDEINLDNRQIEISKELYDLFVQTYRKTEYIGKKGNVTRVADGEYILRKNRVGEGDIRFTVSMINSLFSGIIKTEFEDAQITVTSLIESGAMWYTNSLLKDDRVITKEIATNVMNRYGLYSFKGEKKSYPSFMRYKEVINDEFFEDNYGSFKYEFK
ncbi:hypothetical protein FJQ98_16125 [Lysinibacillus agricola]|uniref:MrpR N-terminal core-binding domain-containing protein n=1 Tax=Lysinibacillus agricola TaxID=2590012 RepID=A0ABX7APC7_9BACI|nr:MULTISPECIES: hypothetical protein [Lysinibacillus]KOS61530.1 hypothetical protein AN161_18245 [Lysinibacillus sp. FJAT-14222]QQP10773.1 hypothetical protein FJQ98_16125 [Lysinibacillus agricola]